LAAALPPEDEGADPHGEAGIGRQHHAEADRDGGDRETALGPMRNTSMATAATAATAIETMAEAGRLP
jgi:hypothetical protein